MSKSAILGSSIAKKYWMALTGLFLSLFLVIHLSGNLSLLKPDGGLAFNTYAEFMTTFVPIKVVSYLLYFSILFHAVDGILLTIQNRKARGQQQYAYNKPGANSSWSSRNMALLGSVLLVFIVVHMAQFWGQMHFGDIAYMMDAGTPYLADGSLVKGATLQDGMVLKDGNVLGKGLKDLYSVVHYTYTAEGMGLVWTLLYVLSMVVLAFHLQHGFASAFQSLGLNHPRYTPIIKGAGKAFFILIPLGFAIIPLIMHFS